jgi:aminoglycoside phosphotransferase (APT) family kinase protein
MVESISKTQISHEQVDAIVALAFGDGALLQRFEACDEGWFNAVYRLVLNDGSQCILKIAPPPAVRVLRYEHDLITTEVQALRLVRERTDLPVPAVIAADDSCQQLPSPWFVMEHCPGKLLSSLRPTLDPDAQQAIDAQLARHLASMNRITAHTFGRPDSTALHDSRWSVAFARLVDDVLADATDVGVQLPLPTTTIAGLIASQAAALDRVTEAHFVHWDLWDPNVFIDPITLEVVGLIDFERVLWGDPLMEAQFTGKRSHGPILEAYGERLLDQPEAVTRRCLYDLYLYLVMTVECAFRNYPTNDIENFGRRMLSAVIDELCASTLLDPPGSVCN